MIVVSDTTPIISLMKAGQLELLQKLFSVIYFSIYRLVFEKVVHIVYTIYLNKSTETDCYVGGENR